MVDLREERPGIGEDDVMENIHEALERKGTVFLTAK